MVKLKLFALSLVSTVCVLLTVIYINRPKEPAEPILKPVAAGVFVTSQLKTGNMPALKRRGIKNIVDLRPDGEAKDQVDSWEIKQAAEDSGLNFHYIPVPHGNIPTDAVDALQKVITDQPAPAVLYCRSGNRAVRTLALVEASRTDGPSAVAINKMVHDTGFSADDLQDNINQRIAKRNSLEEPRK